MTVVAYCSRIVGANGGDLAGIIHHTSHYLLWTILEFSFCIYLKQYRCYIILPFLVLQEWFFKTMELQPIFQKQSWRSVQAGTFNFTSDWKNIRILLEIERRPHHVWAGYFHSSTLIFSGVHPTNHATHRRNATKHHRQLKEMIFFNASTFDIWS